MTRENYLTRWTRSTNKKDTFYAPCSQNRDGELIRSREICLVPAATPAPAASLWHVRCTHAGNIVSFFFLTPP